MSKITLSTDIVSRGRFIAQSPFSNFPNPPTPAFSQFGGIQGEATFVPAGCAGPKSLTDTVANGVHRILLPDNVDTAIVFNVELQEWWLKDGLNFGFEWTNESAGAGNVRFQYDIRSVRIFQDTIAGVTPTTRAETIAAPNAGMIGTGVVAAGATIFDPAAGLGLFGNVYAVTITRLGAGGPGNGDTLAGAAGIVGLNYGRADPDLPV